MKGQMVWVFLFLYAIPVGAGSIFILNSTLGQTIPLLYPGDTIFLAGNFTPGEILVNCNANSSAIEITSYGDNPAIINGYITSYGCNLVLSNFTLIVPMDAAGVVLQSVPSSQLLNVSVVGGLTGLLICNSVHVTVDSSSIAETGTAINVSQSRQVNISYCTVTGNRNGVWVADSQQINFLGCQLMQNQYGFDFEPGTVAQLTDSSTSNSQVGGILFPTAVSSTSVPPFVMITHYTSTDDSASIILSGEANINISASQLISTTSSSSLCPPNSSVYVPTNRLTLNHGTAYLRHVTIECEQSVLELNFDCYNTTCTPLCTTQGLYIHNQRGCPEFNFPGTWCNATCFPGYTAAAPIPPVKCQPDGTYFLVYDVCVPGEPLLFPITVEMRSFTPNPHVESNKTFLSDYRNMSPLCTSASRVLSLMTGDLFGNNCGMSWDYSIQAYSNNISFHISGNFTIHHPTPVNVTFIFGGDGSYGVALLLDGKLLNEDWGGTYGYWSLTLADSLTARVPVDPGTHTVEAYSFDSWNGLTQTLIVYSNEYLPTPAPTAAPTLAPTLFSIPITNYTGAEYQPGKGQGTVSITLDTGGAPLTQQDLDRIITDLYNIYNLTFTSPPTAVQVMTTPQHTTVVIIVGVEIATKIANEPTTPTEIGGYKVQALFVKWPNVLTLLTSLRPWQLGLLVGLLLLCVLIVVILHWRAKDTRNILTFAGVVSTSFSLGLQIWFAVVLGTAARTNTNFAPFWWAFLAALVAPILCSVLVLVLSLRKLFQADPDFRLWRQGHRVQFSVGLLFACTGVANLSALSSKGFKWLGILGAPMATRTRYKLSALGFWGSLLEMSRLVVQIAVIISFPQSSTHSSIVPVIIGVITMMVAVLQKLYSLGYISNDRSKQASSEMGTYL